jgi:hypothetical protein
MRRHASTRKVQDTAIAQSSTCTIRKRRGIS